jgi:hypothetical protein
LGAEHSIELGKQTYSGTRRWLPDNHKYRSARMKAHFNGAVENRQKPRAVSIDEQLQYVAEYEAWKAARNKEGASGESAWREKKKYPLSLALLEGENPQAP